MHHVMPTGEKKQRGSFRDTDGHAAVRPQASLGRGLKVGKCGCTARGRGWGRGQGWRTVVDPRHEGHPEVGGVLVVERVAVPIHRVVEVGVIPMQERESGVRGESAGGQGEEDFQSPLFPDHLLCANTVLGALPTSPQSLHWASSLLHGRGSTGSERSSSCPRSHKQQG